MQWVLNTQGDRLNKFKPIQVDYFDKSLDWDDFVELIRKPVQSLCGRWLQIQFHQMVGRQHR